MSDARPLDGLRVVHLSTVHRLSDPRIRLKECQALVDAGAHVRFVARASSIAVRDEVDEVALTPVMSRFARLVSSQREALAAIRDFAPDVIHFHDPELLLLAPVLRRIAPTVIYDVHESLPDLVLDREWIPARARKLVSSVCGWLEPRLSRLCSGVVLVDRRWASRFAPLPWVEITNPPLRDEFGTVDRSSPATPPHFVYVGELLPERGVHSAVEAINRISSTVRLTLAGPVSTSLAAELENLDTKSRLELPGLVDRDHVGQLLASATAGLVLLEPVPAYDDATATKIFEYLGTGLPLILSDTTAHRRVEAETDAAIVVPYGDVDALQQTMQRLLDDDATWSRLVEAAQAAARSMPTWDDLVPALQDFYATLTGASNTTP